MKKYILTALIILGLLIGTVQAKWIAINNTTTIKYDENGNFKGSEYTKEALGSYAKASICLKMLRIKFNEEKKEAAKYQSASNTPIEKTTGFSPGWLTDLIKLNQ